MTFLRNTWHVAGWASDVQPGQLVSRRLLDEPVVLFRDATQEIKAIGGVCPHRLAPLARGKLAGNMVQCGYHGLGFDASGECVHNPFGVPPKTMKVQAFPVVERYSAIWIWMGDKDRADADLIPDFSFNGADVSWLGTHYLNVKASYELEIENILDLSHIQFLHPDTLGSDNVSKGIYNWREDGEVVWSNRDVTAEIMTDELSRAFMLEPGTVADRWIHVRWNAPSNLAIFAGAVPSGGANSQGFEVPTAHLFTPETETSSHYWFSVAIPRSVGAAGEAAAQQQIAFLRAPFEFEDMPMLEEQQRNMNNQPLRFQKLGWLPGDAAGARARRKLQAKIEAESTGSPLPAMTK